MISKHLKTALDSGLKESSAIGAGDEDTNPAEAAGADPDGGICLDISSEILEVCIKFMHFKLINREISMERPNFDIEPTIALQVLEAAIYLKC